MNFVFGNWGYATIKYNSAGQELWTVRYDPDADDQAAAIALDNLGNVYVTGGSGVSTDSDYVTIKYGQGATPTPTATATASPTPTSCDSDCNGYGDCNGDSIPESNAYRYADAVRAPLSAVWYTDGNGNGNSDPRADLLPVRNNQRNWHDRARNNRHRQPLR
jgi:hypothetical protein